MKKIKDYVKPCVEIIKFEIVENLSNSGTENSSVIPCFGA